MFLINKLPRDDDTQLTNYNYVTTKIQGALSVNSQVTIPQRMANIDIYRLLSINITKYTSSCSFSPSNFFPQNFWERFCPQNHQIYVTVRSFQKYWPSNEKSGLRRELTASRYTVFNVAFRNSKLVKNYFK